MPTIGQISIMLFPEFCSAKLLDLDHFGLAGFIAWAIIDGNVIAGREKEGAQKENAER
jgi:hypothetical protein